MAQRVGSISPEEVSGLIRDYDLNRLNLNPNDTVSTIIDYVSGVNFTNVNTTYNFKRDSIENNGFGKTEQYINGSGFSCVGFDSFMFSNYTMFLVIKQDAPYIVNYLAGTSGGGFDFNILSVSPYRINFREYNSVSAVQYQLTSPKVSFDFTRYNVICINLTRGGLSYIRSSLLNRTVMGTNAPATYTTNTTNTATLYPAYPSAVRGYMRLLVYNRALTEKEETAIFRHLLFKYKI